MVLLSTLVDFFDKFEAYLVEEGMNENARSALMAVVKGFFRSKHSESVVMQEKDLGKKQKEDS